METGHLLTLQVALGFYTVLTTHNVRLLTSLQAQVTIYENI